MIEVLFSKINQLTNKLVKIGKSSGHDLYGPGTRGSVYYGITDSAPRQSFDKYYRNDTGKFPIAIDGPLYYKNLYIDEGVSLYGLGDFASIFVNDTLTLRGNITLANTHSGDYSVISENVSIDTSAKLLLRAETQFLPTTCFFCTGGKNNPAFGNTTYGGGLVGVYYGSVHKYNTLNDKRGVSLDSSSIEDITDVTSHVSAETSNNILGGTSGGCLYIVARHLIIDDGAHIYNYGGSLESDVNTNSGLKFAYKIGVY